jgi:hypothetical protein
MRKQGLVIDRIVIPSFECWSRNLAANRLPLRRIALIRPE